MIASFLASSCTSRGNVIAGEFVQSPNAEFKKMRGRYARGVYEFVIVSGVTLGGDRETVELRHPQEYMRLGSEGAASVRQIDALHEKYKSGLFRVLMMYASKPDGEIDCVRIDQRNCPIADNEGGMRQAGEVVPFCRPFTENRRRHGD